MLRAGTVGDQAGVCQAHRRDASLLDKIEAYQRLDRIILPTRQPREYEQPRSLDLLVHAFDGEGLASEADPAHQPLSARSQVRLDVRGPEPAFRAPPLHALLRAGECGEDPVRRSADFDFFDDRVAGGQMTHRASSRYFLRSRSVPFQKT